MPNQLSDIPLDEISAVGQVADYLGVRPQQITELFYRRQVNPKRAPVVAGRRLIPVELVSVIAMELRRKGIRVRRVGAGETAEAKKGNGGYG